MPPKLVLFCDVRGGRWTQTPCLEGRPIRANPGNTFLVFGDSASYKRLPDKDLCSKKE